MLEAPNTSLEELYQQLAKDKKLALPFMEYGREGALPSAKIDGDRLRDKIRGALFGVGVGDALGRPTESVSPDPKLPRVTEYDPLDKYPESPKGRISDDTQMTVMLTENLLAHGGLYPKDLADRFVGERIIGIGEATREFVRDYKNHEKPWHEAGQHSAGNGAAMRAIPAGLYYRNHYRQLKLAAGLQAMVTHNDAMAIASSIVVAYAAARLLRTEPAELDAFEAKIAFLKELSLLIMSMEKGYKRRQPGMTVHDYSLYDAFRHGLPEYLKAGVSMEAYGQREWTGAYVLESLPAAIYAFLLTPGDFEQTALNAVNHTRDSDTVGAIACGLSGALLGYSAVPGKFRDELELRAQLLRLGDELTEQCWTPTEA